MDCIDYLNTQQGVALRIYHSLLFVFFKFENSALPYRKNLRIYSSKS